MQENTSDFIPKSHPGKSVQMQPLNTRAEAKKKKIILPSPPKKSQLWAWEESTEVQPRARIQPKLLASSDNTPVSKAALITTATNTYDGT